MSMTKQSILVFSTEELSFDIWKFFEVIDKESKILEIKEPSKYPLDLGYARFEAVNHDCKMSIYGKSSGQDMARFMPRFFEAIVDQKKYMIDFLGHIALVNAKYESFEKIKSWSYERPARSEYYAVNRAKEQLKILRQFDAERPIIIASYNHHLQGAMSSQKLSEELNPTDRERIVPIELEDKESALQAIYELLSMSNIKL